MNLFENILKNAMPKPESQFLSGFKQEQQATPQPIPQAPTPKPKMTLFKDEYTML